MSTSTSGPYPAFESNLSRTLRTVGPLLQKYGKARSAASMASNARPERVYVPSGMLLSSWVPVKVTGGDTSFQNLTRGLPKVREGEINTWRAATEAPRSHRPTMSDISAFRRSNAMSLMGQMHANLAQNPAFGSQWIAKHLSPTLRAGSAVETAARLTRPVAEASVSDQYTRPVRGAVETLDRLNRPFAEVAEAIDRNTRPFRDAVEIVDRRLSTIKLLSENLDRKIRVSGAVEILDRLTRHLGNFYYPPRTGGFRSYGPRLETSAPEAIEEIEFPDMASIPESTWNIDVEVLEEAVALFLLQCLLLTYVGYMGVADFINTTADLIEHLQELYMFLGS